jgi:hypothetical protein
MTATLNGHTALSATLPVEPRRSEGYVPSGTQAPAAVKNGFTSKRPRRKDPRKTTPEHLAKFLASMLASYAHRAKGEDPGLVLRDMLAMDAQLHDLINEVGAVLVEQNGAAQVAAELTTAGHRMTRQAANQRWGRGAREQRERQS